MIRRSRAWSGNAPDQSSPIHDTPEAKHRRLLASVIRDITSRETFVSFPDLIDRIFERCRELKVRTSKPDIEAATRMVGSNLPLIEASRIPESNPPARMGSSEQPVPHAQAAALLKRYGVTVAGGRLQAVSVPPAVEDVTPENFPRLVEVR